MRAFLKAAGVEITGKVIVKPGAAQGLGLRPVAQVEGFPVGWQVRGLLKVSNNYISDMFTILYDLEPGQTSGATLRGGSAKLKNFLKKSILSSKSHPNKNTNSLVLNSGSGLTPSNRISAADAVAVFEKMYQHNEFPSFLDGLPGPVEKGTTLSRRFKSQSYVQKIPFLRAKTGTLTQPIDAVALGGYSRTAGGSWVAFAVIVNGSQQRSAFGVPRVRNAIDKDVVTILSKESSKYANK